MLRFDAPYYLLLLILLIIPFWRNLRPHSAGTIIFGATICLPKTKLTWRILLARILPIAYIVALTLLVIAMAKPELSLSTKQQTIDAIAIEMVLDCSGSMETIDTDNSSRLDIAKESFVSFIQRRENDLIGLITFSGYATTKAPLTTNHDILLQLIKSVSTPNNKNEMQHIANKQETLTALGDAITTACAHLKVSKPKTKIIIIITDGISNAGIIDPLKAAHIAKKLNIKIYPINIGKISESQKQQTVLLQKTANISGGKTFSTQNIKELNAVLLEIDKLEKTEIETLYTTETSSFSTMLITIALILILISNITNISITRRLI